MMQFPYHMRKPDADTRAPEKPPYRQPCNGCGLCCAVELCHAAELIGETTTPCRFMRFHDGRFWCGLVEIEAAAGLEPMIAESLGIGLGCLVKDEDAA